MLDHHSSLPIAFQRLRDAIGTGDPTAIRAAIPEPPDFLATLFSLEETERDEILAGVFPVLDTDEDCWELIEAAAMDTIARPERHAFISVARYVPRILLDDAQRLAERFQDLAIADEAHRALDARAGGRDR